MLIILLITRQIFNLCGLHVRKQNPRESYVDLKKSFTLYDESHEGNVFFVNNSR